MAQTVAPEFSSLEERMSGSEFRSAGLDKLSAEELERLNDWLREHLADARAVPAYPSDGADRIGFRETDNRGVVVSRIQGEFTGWVRDTRFELENGQVWQQIDNDSRLTGIRVENPTVTIEPGFLGSWQLSVEGYNTTVRVKRIK